MEDMDIFEDQRDRYSLIENDNEKMKKRLNDIEKRNQHLEYEIDSKN